MKHCIILAGVVGITLFYTLIFSKLCFGLSKGQIYNLEAQNVVNTADLVIKAEHAYFSNYGMFADIAGLEQSSPAYLSPIPVYSFNNEGCVKKILFKINIYICVNLQGGTLNVLMPDDFTYSDIAVREISKGITGKTEQISSDDGLADISFNLKLNPPSFASNPDSASPVSSTLTSPDANGGTSYINTENQNGLINRAVQAVVRFFTAALSLF